MWAMLVSHLGNKQKYNRNKYYPYKKKPTKK
jgi:hypothetical protein